METMIVGETVNDLYVKTLDAILSNGVRVAPRGFGTIEIHPGLLCLLKPWNRILLHSARRLNPGFLCAEAVWILSGSDASWIYDFNSKLLHYTDDGVLQGAYGPRLRQWGGRVDQFEEVLRLLQRDMTSRQATMVLFDPSRDFQSKRDVPCTNIFRFLVRGERLDMTTIMRSQDAWLGLPYDIFNSTLLHELFAGFLGVAVGTYYHFVDSLHLYEKDIPKAKIVVDNPHDFIDVPSSPNSQVNWPEFDKVLAFIIQHAIERSDEAALHELSSDWWQSIGWALLLYKKGKKDRREAVSQLLHIQYPALRAAFSIWWNQR